MPAFRYSIRFVAVAAVAAAAALPGSAAAEIPAGPPADHPAGPPPACAAGTIPTREQPCMLPPCPAGVYPKPGAPCAMPFGSGPTPPMPGQRQQKHGEPGPDGAPGGPGNEGPGGDKAGERGPRSLMSGFVSRVWRFNADADSYDASSNTLNVTVTKMLNLPKRFQAQDDGIVDNDADVIFTKNTKVFDAKGKRLRKESGYDVALDEAGSVSVTGKITPQAKWNKDEDGSPVTTVRAKRVTITG